MGNVSPVGPGKSVIQMGQVGQFCRLSLLVYSACLLSLGLVGQFSKSSPWGPLSWSSWSCHLGLLSLSS